ncbi:MAG: glycosyltransferase, partial [Endomicrobium sp.]|nr:glycosyltransferase [Endomicrobium sp.]
MENNLKFSVLMSVYGKDNPVFFKEVLDSVINQTAPPDEIVVSADGALPSETRELLEEYEKKYKFIKNIFF